MQPSPCLAWPTVTLWGLSVLLWVLRWSDTCVIYAWGSAGLHVGTTHDGVQSRWRHGGSRDVSAASPHIHMLSTLDGDRCKIDENRTAGVQVQLQEFVWTA